MDVLRTFAHRLHVEYVTGIRPTSDICVVGNSQTVQPRSHLRVRPCDLSDRERQFDAANFWTYD